MTIPNPIEYCPIWGESYRAEVSKVPGTRNFSVKSDRAGGAYRITGKAQELLEGKDEAWKARLTTWLIDQREQGDGEPLITKGIVAHINQRRPLPTHERAERLLRLLAKWGEDTVGRSIIVSKGISPRNYCALAWTESTDWDDVAYFLDYLMSMGWTKGVEFDTDEDPEDYPDPKYVPAPEPYPDVFKGVVTVKGFAHIAERKANPDASQAFVAMWFDKSMDKVFDKGFKPAIEDAGYEALRIDRKEDTDKIDDEIIAEIKRSRFVVADFTHDKGGVRGSVYYEAGFARGLGVKVISTCHKSVADKLAFDTRQYNHIIWKTRSDLRKRLKNRIEAVIGRGPGKGRSN